MTSMDETIEFRFARRGDVPQILTFIRELADYEGMLDQVVATEELLTKWLFEKEKAEVLLGSAGERPWDLPCSSTIFPPFWAGEAFIWKICMSVRSTGAADMAKHF